MANRLFALIFVLPLLITACGGKEEWIHFKKTKGDEISSIAQEDGTTLWYGTRRGAVRMNKIEGDKTVFDENQGLSDKNVRTITVDEAGTKWFATAVGLSVYDGTEWSAHDIQNEGMPANDITDVFVVNHNEVWITTGAGVGKFDGTKWETINHTNGLIDDITNCIARDASGRVWVGTASGLTSYDGKNWTVYDSSNSSVGGLNIRSLHVAPDNSLWVGTSRGLGKYDGKSWTIFNTSNTGLPENLIKDVAFGNDGIVWIATTKGLVKFDGSQWTVLKAGKEPLPSDRISALSVDSRGNLWIGTEKDGLCVYKAGGVELEDEGA